MQTTWMAGRLLILRRVPMRKPARAVRCVDLHTCTQDEFQVSLPTVVRHRKGRCRPFIRVGRLHPATPPRPSKCPRTLAPPFSGIWRRQGGGHPFGVGRARSGTQSNDRAVVSRMVAPSSACCDGVPCSSAAARSRPSLWSRGRRPSGSRSDGCELPCNIEVPSVNSARSVDPRIRPVSGQFEWRGSRVFETFDCRQRECKCAASRDGSMRWNRALAGGLERRPRFTCESIDCRCKGCDDKPPMPLRRCCPASQQLARKTL